MIAIIDASDILRPSIGSMGCFPFVFEGTTELGIGKIVFCEDQHYYLSAPNHPRHWFVDPLELDRSLETEVLVVPASWSSFNGTAYGHVIRITQNKETTVELFYSTETQK